MKTLAKAKQKFKRMFGLQHKLQSDFAASQSALIVHGLHKSASMFLYKFFDHVCNEIETPLYSIHNLSPENQKIGSEPRESFVFCPERSFQTAPFRFEFLKSQHLFQVRDPRDILVSEYFSLGWRHTEQNWDDAEKNRRETIRRMTIDEYAINEPEVGKYPLLGRFAPLLSLFGAENIHLVKYETMVNDFPGWLTTVLPLIGLNTPADLSFLAHRYRNEFQADESNEGHKRNVASGDHRHKLKPETIEILNQRFKTVLGILNY